MPAIALPAIPPLVEGILWVGGLVIGAILLAAIADRISDYISDHLGDAIAKADEALLLAVYEKTFGNYCSMLYMKKHYYKRKLWKYYNVLNRTIVPSTEYFLYLSERALAKKNPGMKKNIDGEKSEINAKAVAATIERLSVVDGFN